MADFVVVVGAVVVVVVPVVLVVVLVFVDGDEVVGAVVVAVADEEPVAEVADSALCAPGCSAATKRPMTAVDAVAATTADCVIRRRRRRARSRDWGEFGSSVSFITSSHLLDDVMKPSPPTPHPIARLAPAVSGGQTSFHRAFSAGSHRKRIRRRDGGSKGGE